MIQKQAPPTHGFGGPECTFLSGATRAHRSLRRSSSASGRAGGIHLEDGERWWKMVKDGERWWKATGQMVKVTTLHSLQVGEVVTVRKHSSMGCAVVSMTDVRVRQAAAWVRSWDWTKNTSAECCLLHAWHGPQQPWQSICAPSTKCRSVVVVRLQFWCLFTSDG